MVKVGLLGTRGAPFLVPLAERILGLGVEIDAILLDSKEPSEHEMAVHEERTGGAFPPRPLAELEEALVPCFFVKSHSSSVAARLVRERGIGLLVNAGTPRILREEILAAPSVGVLSCHPGMLPAFRGCTCVEWAVYLDEPVGNSVHFMTAGIDEGPVVVQEEVPLARGDRYRDVRVKVYAHGLDLLAKGVRRVVREGVTPAALPPQGAGRYFEVIGGEQMEAVRARLDRGEYRHLR